MDSDINIEECGEEFATALNKAVSAAKKVPTANRMSFSGNNSKLPRSAT